MKKGENETENEEATSPDGVPSSKQKLDLNRRQLPSMDASDVIGS